MGVSPAPCESGERVGVRGPVCPNRGSVRIPFRAERGVAARAVGVVRAYPASPGTRAPPMKALQSIGSMRAPSRGLSVPIVRPLPR